MQDNRIQNRQSRPVAQTAQSQPDVWYVYDRICKKESKTRQILQEYNTCAADTPDVQPNARTERPLGRAFAESQRQRAEDYFRDNPDRLRTASKTAWNGDAGSGAEGTLYTDAAGNEYIYRPAPAEGGAAVKQQPLQFLRNQLVLMLESLDARRKSDEDAAKRQAIAFKKFSEHRHALFTALLVFVVLLLSVFFTYFAFFIISDVDVEGSDLYTADEVVSAAGFELGDNLYSFHAGQAENLILFHCPQIRSAQISRTVPNAVDIALTDDTAVFYADIYGDTAVLSAGLRVLGFTDTESAKADGLTRLVLPAVKESVAGRLLAFTEEKDLRYVRSVLTAVQESPLFTEGRVGKVDVSDEHSVKINCDGRYILRLGNEKDSDLKLLMGYKTLKDSAFERGIPATVELSVLGEASVRFDMRLVVD